MDGSPQAADPIEKLAENDLGWPNALAIDYFADKWVPVLFFNCCFENICMHTLSGSIG